MKTIPEITLRMKEKNGIKCIVHNLLTKVEQHHINEEEEKFLYLYNIYKLNRRFRGGGDSIYLAPRKDVKTKNITRVCDLYLKWTHKKQTLPQNTSEIIGCILDIIEEKKKQMKTNNNK